MLNKGMTLQEQLLAVKRRLWPEKEKVALLVDGAYLFIETRKRYKKNVDYAALLREAVGKGQLEKAVVFTFEHPAAKRFHNALLDLGYEVQTKPAKTLANGKRKCNHDGEIITEMFKLAKNGIHKIVLATGDSDFASPIQHLKKEGKKIRIIGIRGTIAWELKDLAPVRYINEGMLIAKK